MPLTSKQDLPNQPGHETQSWSSRSLIALQSAIGTMAKAFNALEAILLFQVFVAGLGELIGRRMSIGWYIILGLTLAVNAYLRFLERDDDKKK